MKASDGVKLKLNKVEQLSLPLNTDESAFTVPVTVTLKPDEMLVVVKVKIHEFAGVCVCRDNGYEML